MCLLAVRGNGQDGCCYPRPGSSWRVNDVRKAAMTPTTTRRVLLAGAAASLAHPAAAQQATTLKLYTLGYEVETGTLAWEVSKRTEGRYRIETIIGFDRLEAALGKERTAGGEGALIEGAQSGDLDLVVTAGAPVGNYVPETQVFNVPFLFRDYAHARAVLDGPIGQDILARFPAHGLVLLAWSEQGFRHLTNSKRPIRTPEDLKGLKLRTQENAIIVEAFRTLGAEVTPMPWGRAILDALARGVLDAEENTVDTILNWEVFRWQKYLSLTGHIYGPAVIIMSMPAYAKLSSADKQAFVDSARLAGQLARKDDDDHDATVVVQLLDVGMKINDDVDKAAFRAALVPANAEWREQYGDLIDRIQAYQ
jgi:tripartite ATP-independent transporter DctP family solute receptor